MRHLHAPYCTSPALGLLGRVGRFARYAPQNNNDVLANLLDEETNTHTQHTLYPVCGRFRDSAAVLYGGFHLAPGGVMRKGCVCTYVFCLPSGE